MMIDNILEVNNKKYDMSLLANCILKKYPAIRDTPKYKSMKEKMIDETMSCDSYEQEYNMRVFMKRGVEEDRKGEINMDSVRRAMGACGYLAAYDLYKSNNECN